MELKESKLVSLAVTVTLALTLQVCFSVCRVKIKREGSGSALNPELN